MLSHTLRLAIVLSLLSAAACGDDSSRPMDAGMTGDGGEDAGMTRIDAGERMDSGPTGVELATCDMPRMLTGEIGTVMIEGDTSEGVNGPRDLGPDCGNVEAARWSPQDVVQYEVPGTGPIALTLSVVNDGTDMAFDSILQVRTDCAMIPEASLSPTCLDDASSTEWRSEGSITVDGGSTLFIFVTGYAETPYEGATDRGAYRLEVTARTNELPTVTGGEVRIVGARADVVVDGTDADMDPFAFVATFQDDTGAALDLNDDGTVDDGDDVAQVFGNLDAIDGMATYTGITQIADLGTRLTAIGATQASVRLIDAAFGIGDAMTLPVNTLTEVGLGATCDDMNVCVDPLTCTAGTCTAPAEVVTACSGASPIAVPTPTTMTTTATASGSLATGTGVLSGSCGMTQGAEALHTVVVPAGAYDLFASTETTGTGDADTVLYVRSTCEDPLTEVGCNDDVSMEVLASELELLDVAAGTYTIAVEPYGEASAAVPYEVSVSLRPVLASGASCDPAGIQNRCASAACDGTTMMCP